MISGQGFTDEERALFSPSADEPQWRRKERDVVRAAHDKCIERDKARAEKQIDRKTISDLQKTLSERDEIISQLKRKLDGQGAPEPGSISSEAYKYTIDQLRTENMELKKQAALNIDDDSMEDEFVTRKIQECRRLNQQCQDFQSIVDRLSSALQESEQKCTDLLGENTALKVELNDGFGKNSKRLSWNSGNSGSPSDIQIASLRDFPTLPMQRNPSRASLAYTDDSNDGYSSGVSEVLSRLKRLESMVLERTGGVRISSIENSPSSSRMTKWGEE